MSNWADGIMRYTVKLERLADGLLPAVAATAHESIQTGSPITTAPGQPVDEGNLRTSWQVYFPDAETAEISTKSEYAIDNETGVRHDGRPYIQRSPVGGRHSVALTVQHFQRIVDHEAARLTG